MDRRGGSDRSGIASFRRTPAVDSCALGPAAEFGPLLVRPPERPTRREHRRGARTFQSCPTNDETRSRRSFPAKTRACPIVAGFRSSAHLSEALAQFSNEQLRLFKRGEVTTFRNLVPVEELRIGLVAPYPRRCKK